MNTSNPSAANAGCLARRPNILFLMSDQHRADFVGYEGHLTRTPTLDWLAAGGVRFRNAYAPNPVCVPCRQSMMAGQLPRTTGVLGFHHDLPPGYMTFAQRFSQYAYETVCCGKLHHTGRDQMQGWRWRIGEEMHLSPRNIPGRVEEEFARYSAAGSYSPLVSVLESGRGFNPVELVDSYTTQGALNFIRLYFYDGPGGKRQSQPVLLKHSLIAPHDPFLTNNDSYDYYYPRVTLFPAEDPLPEIGGWPPPFGLEQAPLEARRRAMAAYCTMIEGCDRQFARVLDALRAAGENLDDWIIVYASDHGEMMGQRNLWWKFRFYEGSVRVPLVIRAPRYFRGGQVVMQNVNLCDLFATLCDLAGLTVPEGLDSRTLLPLMQGRTAGWNNETVSHVGVDNLMIKRDHLKYIYAGDRQVEILFDLAVDPGETVNKAADSKYAPDLAAFRLRRDELGYGPDGGKNYVNAGYRWDWDRPAR